jgi:hypothetical protein
MTWTFSNLLGDHSSGSIAESYVSERSGSASMERNIAGFAREGSQVRSLHRPPSSPDKQRWFPNLRKSPLFQRLGETKRSLRLGFPLFAPPEWLEMGASLWRQNAVSQID